MDDEALAGLGLTFSAACGASSRADGGERGGVCEVELVPGGREVEVNHRNRDEFLILIRRHWLLRRAASCRLVRKVR